MNWTMFFTTLVALAVAGAWLGIGFSFLFLAERYGKEPLGTIAYFTWGALGAALIIGLVV